MVERIHKSINTVIARLAEDKAPMWIRLTEYLIAGCLMLQCRTFWVHMFGIGPWVNRGIFVVLVFAFALLSIYTLEGKREICCTRKQLKNCIIIILYLAVYVLVVPVNAKGVIRCTIILVMTMLLFYSPDSREKIKRLLIKYKNIMVFLAAFSVACWVLLSVFHLLPYPWTGSIYITWTNDGEVAERSTFLYLYSEMQWFIVHYVTRNTSIFVEGPMYCYCLSIALFVELFAEDKTRTKERKFCRWSLLLAELTCLTTVGFIFLTVIGAAYYIRSRAEMEQYLPPEIIEKNRKVIRIAVVAALILCVWFVYRKLSVVSGTVRMDDIFAGIEAWLTKPWFGSGFENQTYIDKFISTWRVNNLGYSNSPGLILANGGVYLAVIYVYAWVRIIKNALRRRTYEAYIVTALYILMFTVTIIPYQYLTMFFMLTLVTDSFPYTEETEIRFSIKQWARDRRGAKRGK